VKVILGAVMMERGSILWLVLLGVGIIAAPSTAEITDVSIFPEEPTETDWDIQILVYGEENQGDVSVTNSTFNIDGTFM